MKKISVLMLSMIMIVSMVACTKSTGKEEQSTTAVEANNTSVSTTAETTTKATTSTTKKTTTTTKKETTTKKVTTTKKKTTTTKKVTTTKAVKNGNFYDVVIKNKSIKPNDNMKTVLKEIGKPGSSPMKSESCMATGYDMLYTYSGYEIESFCPEKGSEKVININITGKKVETGNGLKVGANSKKAIKSTGLKFKSDDGIYEYKKGDYKITVFDDGGKIESIFIESTKY